MSYLKLYNNLINRARNRILSGYSETHHIIPRCMGGSDSKSNLVELTAKEHFVAHHLLCKAHPENYKLKFAFVSMTRSSNKQKRFTPKSYDAIKKANAEALSILHKGRFVSEETKARQSASLRGKKKSAEHIAKMPKFPKGHIPANKGKKSPGVGGCKKGCVGRYNLTPESVAKIAAIKAAKCKPLLNTSGLKILTPDGFKSFEGIVFSGLVPCLTFTLANGMSVTVSKKHRFDTTEKRATEYKIGEYLLVNTVEIRSQIVEIKEAGKRQVFDLLHVADGHLYYGNDIAQHNSEFVTDTEMAIFPEARDEVMNDIVYDHPRPQFFTPFTAIDLGYVDNTGILFGYYDFAAGKIVIEDEILLNKTTSGDIVNLCKAKELELWGKDKEVKHRVVDGNAMQIADFNSMHRFKCYGPEKTDLIANVNRVRIDINDRRMFIHPRCSNLIAQVKHATWDKSKTKFSRSSDAGHWDLVAALIYFIKHIDRVTNPIPPGLGYNVYDHFGYPRKHKTTHLEVFKNMFPALRRDNK